MNKIELLGRLTKDVEMKQTKTGKKVATFTIAVAKNKENAIFVNILAFDKLGEIAEKYLKKGRQVVIVGSLNIRDYEDKEGKKHYVTEVLAENLYFVGNNKQDEKEELPDMF